MENLFEELCYRRVIERQIKVHKSIRGYRKSLANGAGCQPSYLSKALQGGCELTPDHGAGISAFWGLNDLETQYFMELIRLARAGTKSLRRFSRKRIDSLREDHDDLSRKLSGSKPVETDAFYYSQWYVSAIHVLASIPGMDTPKEISNRLEIDENVVSDCLHRLYSDWISDDVQRQIWYCPRIDSCLEGVSICLAAFSKLASTSFNSRELSRD